MEESKRIGKGKNVGDDGKEVGIEMEREGE